MCLGCSNPTPQTTIRMDFGYGAKAPPHVPQKVRGSSPETPGTNQTALPQWTRLGLVTDHICTCHGMCVYTGYQFVGLSIRICSGAVMGITTIPYPFGKPMWGPRQIPREVASVLFLHERGLVWHLSLCFIHNSVQPFVFKVANICLFTYFHSSRIVGWQNGGQPLWFQNLAQGFVLMIFRAKHRFNFFQVCFVA